MCSTIPVSFYLGSDQRNKNVHNEAQGINLEVQLWSPNLLVDVPLQGKTTSQWDNEEGEYDPDYGVE